MGFFELGTLEKAKGELTRLEAEDSIDHVYNFFVTAYHIVDCLKNKDRFPQLDVKAIKNEPFSPRQDYLARRRPGTSMVAGSRLLPAGKKSTVAVQNIGDRRENLTASEPRP